MKAFQILGFLLAGGVLAPAQVGSLSDEGRRVLVRASSVIVVAVPEPDRKWIVNRPKMEASRATGSLVDPSEYIVGRLINARVVDVLKGDGSVKKDELLKLFVNGWQDSLDAGNVLVPGEKNILFLSRLNASDPKLKDVGLYSPHAKVPEILSFDVANVYKPTQESHSVLSPTPMLLRKLQNDILAQARRSLQH